MTTASTAQHRDQHVGHVGIQAPRLQSSSPARHPQHTGTSLYGCGAAESLVSDRGRSKCW